MAGQIEMPFTTMIAVMLTLSLILQNNLLCSQATEGHENEDKQTIDTEFMKAVFGGIGPVMNPPDIKTEEEGKISPRIKKHQKKPEQIHIAYGSQPSEMVVMWSTAVETASTVLYGLAPRNYTLSTHGQCVSFTLGNPSGLQYIHRVQLTDLIPGQNYSYKIQTDDGVYSDEFLMKTMTEGEDWSPNLLVYGDMGRVGGAPSLKLLTKEALSGRIDAAIHVGDFAYDLHTEGGKYGDDFMNRIQELATRIPYMTTVGNHEIPYSFSHYRYRFSMPNLPWPTPEEKMWYSFNIGKAHFISYSTEVYFTNGPIESHYQWLLDDLREANKPENRSRRPWIIAYGHRPMYCSNVDGDDCTKADSIVRAGLEELFFNQGVDIIIQGHEHSYERLWPVYKDKVFTTNYSNPRAPIHIISGSAGCNEFDGVCVNPMLGPRGDWSAFRAWLPGLYGFGKLNIVNSTHVHWEQILALNGQVIDSAWIEQQHHGPFKLSEEEEKDLLKDKNEEDLNFLREWLDDDEFFTT
ncbi:acid phosphatase type 7-like [Ptychodera flava]|uniref:acid phosphatase type 7-like n=1 Tax=Ptychodera flava TaxID=63121 RepID=UPI00396A9DCE